MHRTYPTPPAPERAVVHTLHTGIDARPNHFVLYLLGTATSGIISSAPLALPRGNLGQPLVVLLASQACLIFLGTVCLLGDMGYNLARHTGALEVGSWSAGLVGARYGLGAMFGALLSTASVLASFAFRPTLLASHRRRHTPTQIQQARSLQHSAIYCDRGSMTRYPRAEHDGAGG